MPAEKGTAMRNGWLAGCLLLSVIALGSLPIVPDSGKVTGNTFESTYFNFRYSFPQGWSAVNDDVRMVENRKRHEAEAEKERQKFPPDTGTQTTIVLVCWNYDLLTATPAPLSAGKQAGLPHIFIWARQRFSMLNDACDNTNVISSFPGTKVLRKAENVTFSGHEFVRTDFVHNHGNYEALFVTVIGEYQLGFEFRGRSESEINKLAASMKNLQFSKR